MANISGLNDALRARIAEFQRQFPMVTITSGFRDPTHNARVGGARGSQHTHGNAIDFSLRGLPEDKQLAVLQWWRDQGARGFGYYPNSTSAHVDFGSPRAWGPNYRASSLGQTPKFFQDFVGAKIMPQAAAGPAQPTDRSVIGYQPNASFNPVAPTGTVEPAQVAPLPAMPTPPTPASPWMDALSGGLSGLGARMAKTAESVAPQAPQRSGPVALGGPQLAPLAPQYQAEPMAMPKSATLAEFLKQLGAATL